MGTISHEVSIPKGYESSLSIKCKWSELKNGDSGERKWKMQNKKQMLLLKGGNHETIDSHKRS